MKSFVKSYRGPIAVTFAALLGVTTVAVAGQQYVQAHMNDYYRVYVNGSPIGEISSSAKVEQWLDAKAAALSRANTPVVEELDEDQVEYRAEKAYKFVPNDQATLTALAGEVKTHAVGVEVWVGGKVVGVVRDKATANALLDRVKEKYVPEDAKLVQAVAKKSSTPHTMTLAFSASSAEEQEQEPDDADGPQRKVTSIQIAEQVGLLTVNLEKAELSDPDALYKQLVGESDANGKPLAVQSVEEVTQLETIAATTEYQDSSDLRKGTTKVARQGKDGQKQVTYKQVKMNGQVVQQEIIGEQVVQEPVSKLVLKGTKVIPGEGTGKFAWPVSGHRITSTMGKRWGTMHNGIDMIGRSTIKAADNGVVEQVVYSNKGLGNHVIINHKNGYKTVYGHMKSISVKKGQVVEKGEALGVMGSTGHSTGTHLHFEVHLNGKLKNPLNYL